MDVIDEVEKLFKIAIDETFPENTIKSIIAASSSDSDYRCMSTMKFKNKEEMANQIISSLMNNNDNNDIISKVEFNPIGFIDIYINPQWISDKIYNLWINQNNHMLSDNPLNIILDYSSPNIAKDPHVGHLRSTVIGDVIGKMLEHYGHNVIKVSHVGDFGTPFGMLIALLEEKITSIEDLETFTITDLQSFYKESKKRFDNDPDFKKTAYEMVVLLQSHNPKIVKMWNKICDISRNQLQLIYDRLEITGLTEIPESFYHPYLQNIVDELKELGLVTVDNLGRHVMFMDGYKIPLILIKSDGSFTYDTTDLAAIKYRIFEQHADKILYVVDSGQQLHFKLIFKAAEVAGWLERTNNLNVELVHVKFGLVLGADKKKFKTRSGETVKLTHLLDEALIKSENVLKEKIVDEHIVSTVSSKIIQNIAYGSIKYADLSNNRLQDYVFNIDQMLNMKGNTAVYLLYVYTRISSIIRKCEKLGIILTRNHIHNMCPPEMFKIDKKIEIELSNHILCFNKTFKLSCEGFYPHYLCEYLHKLCGYFNKFYTQCKCVDYDPTSQIIKEINYSRLILCQLTLETLETGLNLLGINYVTFM